MGPNGKLIAWVTGLAEVGRELGLALGEFLGFEQSFINVRFVAFDFKRGEEIFDARLHGSDAFCVDGVCGVLRGLDLGFHSRGKCFQIIRRYDANRAHCLAPLVVRPHLKAGTLRHRYDDVVIVRFN